MSKHTSRYTDILLEGIDGKVTGIAESVTLLTEKVQSTKQDVEELKTGNALIRPMFLAIKDMSRQLKNHEARLITIEGKQVLV